MRGDSKSGENKTTIRQRHPLYGGKLMRSRLKSRKNFLKIKISLLQTPEVTRIDLWKEKMKEYNSQLWMDPNERLPSGSHLPWLTWKTLNRLRTKTGKLTEIFMKKWGIKEGGKCKCGEDQDADYLFTCLLLLIRCRKEDFMRTTILCKTR